MPDKWGFDVVGESYDDVTYFKQPISHLTQISRIETGDRVLDIACGTGWMTLEVLRRVGPPGNVIGIDLSEVLIKIARDKLTAQGFQNFDLAVMDGQHLDYDDESFNAISCASALMAFPDILSTLLEWKRVLKPGGRVAFSSWGVGFRMPHRVNLVECINRVNPGPAPLRVNESLDSAIQCQDFLAEAGFGDIEVSEVDLSYTHTSFESYWREVTSDLIKAIHFDRLSSKEIDQVKELHRTQVSGNEIAINLPVIFSCGVKVG